MVHCNYPLQITLKIPDTPMMAMGAMPMHSAPQQDVSFIPHISLSVNDSFFFFFYFFKSGNKSEAKEEEPATVSVKLVKFADDSKIKVIKEIKALIEGMNLVQVLVFLFLM